MSNLSTIYDPSENSKNHDEYLKGFERYLGGNFKKIVFQEFHEKSVEKFSLEFKILDEAKHKSSKYF